MKEMYKDNAGNWHYGCKGEKLTEVSYSTNSVPDSIPVEWIKDYVDSGVSDDIFQRNRRFVLNMIKDWEKENENNR